MKNLYALFLLAIIMLAASRSSGQTTIGVGDVFPGKVEYAAFTLASDETVNVRVLGGTFSEEDWKMLVYYGWIIDSETRKTVWHTADKVKDGLDFEFGKFDVKDAVPLKKGTYEIYFTGAFHQRENNFSMDGLTSVVDQVFGDRRRVNYTSELREAMGITVSGHLIKVATSTVLDAKLKDAVVSIIKPGNNANVKKGFSLTAQTTLRVYAIGEVRKDETFDYAWIYDVASRKRVWVMDYSNAKYAGGSKKNRVSDEKITLPAGNYLVSYVTDESHSYNDWNSMPPEDPQFSGITISTTSKTNVGVFNMPEEIIPVLQLTKVRDDDMVSKGITVKTTAEFRVLCLGEESGDDMADYGWIMNAATKEVVWDMAQRRREHAGGAEKNKMVDEIVKLEKGDYIVYYTTDGSHAYGDWNSGPPHEQDDYGITLWATKKEDIAKAGVFNPAEYKNEKVIVEIVRVRDDAYMSESFTLDKDTKLRVIAMGEGDDDELVDYGWIKNTETGKVVWEMTYRNTESAGGASKNRIFNDILILPKGTYKVFYETDGSHAYRSWNASPPRDPERYGISLMKDM